MLEIIPFPALKDNYIWLLKNTASDHIAIVDPGESVPLLEYIDSEGLKPVAILITHHHWDHVNGIMEIIEKHDIPVYTPKTETVDGSTHPVGEGEIIALTELGLELQILDVPGHTNGAVAYYTKEFVFSGDTLFTAGCGRMFEGTPPLMHASLSKFKSLPQDTLVYCGHEYTEANLRFAQSVEPENIAIQERLEQVRKLRQNNSPTVPEKLELELETNPFLRCEIPGVIASAEQHSNRSLKDPSEVFAEIRKWKDNF